MSASSETPETDAIVAKYIGSDEIIPEEADKLLDKARTLERERNEATLRNEQWVVKFNQTHELWNVDNCRNNEEIDQLRARVAELEMQLHKERLDSITTLGEMGELGAANCQLRAKNAELEKCLAECYKLTGADPDGNEDFRLAPLAVQEVRRLRSESDEAEKDKERLDWFDQYLTGNHGEKYWKVWQNQHGSDLRQAIDDAMKVQQ